MIEGILPYIYYESFRIIRMKPTDAELEVLQILWDQGPLTVRKVNEKLNEQRRVGYTTTLKIMQIMLEKGLVMRDADRRSHVYAPLLQPDEVQHSIIDHLLKTVFNGNRTRMIMSALGNHDASSEELEEIRKLIEKMEEQNDGAV